MASLTGNQIQTSYQGLLKTEGNGVLPVGYTNITDGEGNETGLFFWKQYATMGVKNDNTYNQVYLEAKNVAFDKTQSPMGAAGGTNLSFSDVSGAVTYTIQQNRFGGVTYLNQIDGQPHIFDGPNNNSSIVMDNFGNANNSNNWYTGYLDSLTSASVVGTNLTLSRPSGDISLTLPSSGGGGVTHRTDQFITSGRYDSGNGGNFTFFTNTTIFIPIYLTSGEIGSAAVYNHALSATANAVNLSLWTAGSTASSNPGGGYGGPSVLLHDFGNVDTSVTTGLKEITGAAVTVEEGLYYMAIGHLGSWDTSFKVYDENQNGRGQLHYVVDDEGSLGTTSTQWPSYYDAFNNTNLASTTYASTPYSGSLSITSAKCAMFLKYNS